MLGPQPVSHVERTRLTLQAMAPLGEQMGASESGNAEIDEMGRELQRLAQYYNLARRYELASEEQRARMKKPTQTSSAIRIAWHRLRIQQLEVYQERLSGVTPPPLREPSHNSIA